MIQLTEQQHREMDQKQEEPIRAIDPATNEQYVLLRADVYDRLKPLLADVDESAADDQYQRAYESTPEDITDIEALLPHLPLPKEEW